MSCMCVDIGLWIYLRYVIDQHASTIIVCKNTKLMLLHNVMSVYTLISVLDKHRPFSQSGSTNKLADNPGLAILVTCDYAGTSAGTIPGTNVDADKMLATFNHLNYAVHQLKSTQSTKANIEAKLNEIATEFENYSGPTDNKVIVFAYSGHGIHEDDEEYILTHDEEKIHIIAEIILPLEKKKVADIPKLFLIDFCHRGKQLEALMKAKQPAPTYTDSSGGVSGSSLQTKGDDDAPRKVGYMHVESNYRIDISVISGHNNTHDDEYGDCNGSVWMRNLADIIVRGNESFQNIAAKAKKRVHEKDTSHGPEQMVRSFDRLDTGPLYLTH